MSTFNEADHPRRGDGQWATKTLDETDPGFGEKYPSSEDPTGDDPDYPMSDWQMEVANGDTQCGYEDWADALRERDSLDEAQMERSLQLDVPPPDLEARLEAEREHAEHHGYDPFDEDTPMNWLSMERSVGRRYAEDLYDRCDGSVGAATAISNREMSEYGIDRGDQIRAFARADLKPEDLVSEDRDLRMHAAAARGDLVFDGELMSHAFELSRHSSRPELKGRIIGRPRRVSVVSVDQAAGTAALNQLEWKDLSTTDQLAYVDGYTAVMESQIGQCGTTASSPDRSVFKDRQPKARELAPLLSDSVAEADRERMTMLRRSGQEQARRVCRFEAEMATGERPENIGAYISYPTAQRGELSVGRITPAPGRPGAFRAYPDSTQLVYRFDGTTFELNEHTPVEFRAGEYLSDQAF